MPTFEEVEVEILRRMTPEQKLHTVQSLWEQARAFKAAGLRMDHPDWTDQQIEDAVRTFFARGSV